jgi:chromosomal replication initiator protein
MLPPANVPTSWESVKAELKTLFPSDVFSLWFEPMQCRQIEEGVFSLSVPNEFASIWIRDNYLDLLVAKLAGAFGHPVQIRLQPAEAEAAPVAPEPRPVVRPTRSAEERGSFGLNPRNTFENFVVGSNCLFAHAAAIAVAQAPAQVHNPLFLYGATGLGKTHLMHAVGHCILGSEPQAKVVYLSCEKFTNEFIEALQAGAVPKFRQRYRKVDILLIDDVQFLSGKESVQEEFFHTFNELHGSGKQIILCSDRPASEIARLESRLQSRFQWGLVADIQPPDYETRVAILRAKAKASRFQVPNEAIDFIASRITRNIRRLEGALNKVGTYFSLTSATLDTATLEMLLKDLLMEESQRQITIDLIQKAVCEKYELRPSDMVSRRRPANIALPRQIAMYLSRVLTKRSLQEIGEGFGGRDHGTVIHACKAVENAMDQDSDLRQQIEFLKKALAG